MQFDLDRNINGAARDVQAAINAARGFLPPNLPAQPNYRKVNPSDAPVLIVALTSDTPRPGPDVRRRVEHHDAEALPAAGRGPGLRGRRSALPAVRVDLNPTALSKYGISLEDVRGVLTRTSVNRPKGQIVG